MRLADVPEITLAEILQRYDALLLDAYGVFMNSAGAIDGAIEAMGRIEASGKPYWIVTNDASRLPETSATRYGRFGFDIDEEQVLTSGGLLVRHFAEHGLTGARCIVLGPDDSLEYVRRAGGRVVPPSEDADVLVVADEEGYPFVQSIDAVVSLLFRRIEAGSPPHLLLPNPDLFYPKGGDQYGVTSGSVAHLLEGVLRHRYPDRDDLRFTPLGKPHAPMFDEARRRAAAPRLVMLGDNLQTDILGANRAGIDSVLLGTGATPWEGGLALTGAVPTFRMRSLG